MTNPRPQRKAGGDINPSRFVKADTSQNSTVLQAAANEQSFGISSEAAQKAPIDGASTLAAASGDYLKVYGEGEICLLELGTGGCATDDWLKPDVNGKGVACATSGPTEQKAGARALEAGSAGEKVRVMVKFQRFYPALS